MTATLWGDRIAAAAFTTLALYMGYLASDFPAGGDMFPLFVSGCMILISAAMLITTLLKPGMYVQELKPDLSWNAWKPMVVMILGVLYVLAIFAFGYFVSTVIFLLVTPLVAGLRRPVAIALNMALTVLFIYLLFAIGLKAQLPEGILF